MAHLSFLIRGHKFWQDKFINELSTRYLNWKKYNPQTKQMDAYIFEARLCPIQLYDFVFPEEQKDVVLNTVLSGGDGKPTTDGLKTFIWSLRKGMGFKKIPEYKKDFKLSMAPIMHNEVIGIGYKEDYWIDENGKKVSSKDKTPLSTEGL